MSRRNRITRANIPDFPVCRFRGAPWSQTSTGVRREHRCIRCRETIPKGVRAWRPMHEVAGVVRDQRLCGACVEGAERISSPDEEA